MAVIMARAVSSFDIAVRTVLQLAVDVAFCIENQRWVWSFKLRGGNMGVRGVRCFGVLSELHLFPDSGVIFSY